MRTLNESHEMGIINDKMKLCNVILLSMVFEELLLMGLLELNTNLDMDCADA